MGAKIMLFAMVAGTVAVITLGKRERGDRPAPEASVKASERPWLSREAAAQLVGPEGTLGPVFAGAVVGGPEPSAEVRARVAAFARQHDVDIALEVVDDELRAVRLGVTFHGGVGYEGADVFALRLGRRSTGVCCVCGPDTWINDWRFATEDGLHGRASVRVNRVEVVWESLMSVADVIDLAEGLVGEPASRLPQTARFTYEGDDGERNYALMLPFVHGAALPLYGKEGWFDEPAVVVAGGTIREVAFGIYEEDAGAMLRARWGRPRVVGETSHWRRGDVAVELDRERSRITVRSRGLVAVGG